MVYFNNPVGKVLEALKKKKNKILGSNYVVGLGLIWALWAFANPTSSWASWKTLIGPIEPALSGQSLLIHTPTYVEEQVIGTWKRPNPPVGNWGKEKKSPSLLQWTSSMQEKKCWEDPILSIGLLWIWLSDSISLFGHPERGDSLISRSLGLFYALMKQGGRWVWTPHFFMHTSDKETGDLPLEVTAMESWCSAE